MKEKLIRFMAGRYGFDSLGKATIIAALAAVVLASLFDIPVLSWLAWALIIYAYFRMFSRNIYKRSTENQTYLAKTRRLRTWFSTQKNLLAQRKTHHIQMSHLPPENPCTERKRKDRNPLSQMSDTLY